MKSRLLSILCAVCLLAGCAPRNASPSSSEALPPEEPSSSAASEEPPSASALSSEPEQAPEPEKEPEPEYPAPLLTDTEKELLSGNLALFAHFIGKTETTAAQLPKETVLAASLADIERTKDMNAYFFEQDDSGNDLIPAEIVKDKASQLFGIENFDAAGAESYNSEKDCFAAKPVEIAPAQASDIMGAPDDHVAYRVGFPEGGDYIYTARILRQNGMPYLQFAECRRAILTDETAQ